MWVVRFQALGINKSTVLAVPPESCWNPGTESNLWAGRRVVSRNNVVIVMMTTMMMIMMMMEMMFANRGGVNPPCICIIIDDSKVHHLSLLSMAFRFPALRLCKSGPTR